jgi:hypothetical protein
MTPRQLAEYDLLLDENDWDIYYWATQEQEQPQQQNTAASENENDPAAQQQQPQPEEAQLQNPRPGEWAQTVGTFKPAYRPVPARWRDSEILKLLRKHVESRRGDSKGTGKGGMGFMPPLEEYK